MSKVILVTGGAGFIGSNFVHWILDRYPDYSLIVVDLLTYAGSMDNLPAPISLDPESRVDFYYGDVCNTGLINKLVAKSDYVVHFAAETHVTRSIFDNIKFFQTDVLGSQVVANAVLDHGKNVKRLIHISTSEVYGTAETETMDENHPLNPMSPYASAKCGADRLMYSYWATYKMPVTILRPFNNYGSRQHLEKVLPRFITNTLLGDPLMIHGDGSAARDFVHTDDTCQAIDLVIHADDSKVNGEVFNVASGTHHSILDLANSVAKLMGQKVQRNFRGDRPGQVFRHTGDSSKIKRVLGWKKEVTWEEGLARTIKWYEENEPIWRQMMWSRQVPIITANGKKEMH